MPTKKLKIHFIGIGGIGVSALAKYYLKKGCKISGSDLVSSEITDALKKLGAKISIRKHKKESVPKDASLVIFSPAVNSQNPERKEARRLKIKTRSYPQGLGDLTKKHYTIAISGTHGKSTTTCMIGLLLKKAGFDPTVIVGTKMREFESSNCIVGKSKYLVIEADEHFASLLNYRPKIIVLTTIEADHLDFYKNLGNILKTFKKYVNYLPKDGFLVANKDDKNILKVLKNLKRKKILYSLSQPEAKKLKKILSLPGSHNVSNALAALSVAGILKISDKTAFRSLSQYKGCWRRFETFKERVLGKKIILISDYGHHPTEIEVTLKAAREKYPNKKIFCVFQPHQYQRTFFLFNDFVRVFKKVLDEGFVDKIILSDIYDVAGREGGKIRQKTNSRLLSEKTNRKGLIYVPTIPGILNYLKKNLRGGEVLIIMGAGNIYDLTRKIQKIKK